MSADAQLRCHLVGSGSEDRVSEDAEVHCQWCQLPLSYRLVLVNPSVC